MKACGCVRRRRANGATSSAQANSFSTIARSLIRVVSFTALQISKHKNLLARVTVNMSLHRTLTHPEFVEGCFGCKAATLQWVSMDAHAKNRLNDRELDAYRSARKQGIQPKSTQMKDIRAAEKVSQITGRAV